METAGGLPLGITPSVPFAATRMALRMGETLIFVSACVLEARTRTGELFGFTRAVTISTQPAGAIALRLNTLQRNMGFEHGCPGPTRQFFPHPVNLFKLSCLPSVRHPAQAQS